MKSIIYTIGHSTHPIDYFLSLLNPHDITLLVDVRSIAASRFNPQYNLKQLSAALFENRIQYRHMPEAFGARRSDPKLLFDNGQVNFALVRKTQAFLEGIEWLLEKVSEDEKVVLMCAESDPLSCHRFSMITPALKEAGVEIQHILKYATVLANSDLEKSLLEKYKDTLPKADLFNSNATLQDQLDKAYQLHNLKIGYNAKAKKDKGKF